MNHAENEQLIKLATGIMEQCYANSGKNTIHCSIEGIDVNILIFRKCKKPYENLGSRQKRRTGTALASCWKLLGMASGNVFEYVTSRACMSLESLKNKCSNPDSPVYKRLGACGLPRPLETLESVALLMSRSYTERDAQFVCKYFGGLDTTKKLREARWSLNSNRPSMFTLDINSNNWKLQSAHAANSRLVQAARFDLKSSLCAYLQSAKSSNRWPHPPRMPVFTEDQRMNSLIFQLSIDSGGGTTKIMGRFIRDRGFSLSVVQSTIEKIGIAYHRLKS